MQLTTSSWTLEVRSKKIGKRLSLSIPSICSAVRQSIFDIDDPFSTICRPQRKCWNSASYDGSLRKEVGGFTNTIHSNECLWHLFRNQKLSQVINNTHEPSLQSRILYANAENRLYTLKWINYYLAFSKTNVMDWKQ